MIAYVFALTKFESDNNSNVVNTFLNDKILNSSKLKEFADDSFKFGENGRKFFK